MTVRITSNIDYECRPFSRGVIFTRARVLLALLSLRKNGGLLVVYLHRAPFTLHKKMGPDSLFSGFGAIGGYGPKTEKKTSPDPFS